MEKSTIRSLHLALLVSGLSGGGTQRRMLTLARVFAERGHRVDLVAVRSGGPFRSQLAPPVRLVGLDPAWAYLPGLAASKGLWVMAATPAIAGYLRRERPDVLLSSSNPANLAGLWARRLAGVAVPIALTVNVNLTAATGERQRAWGPLLRRLVCSFYPRAEAVIANSLGSARDLAQVAGIRSERLHAIPNPVDVKDIRRHARAAVNHSWLLPSAPPVILAVGKLKRQKDFPTLLHAFARVRRGREARLVILGEGPERRRLERLARRLGVAADVALPGFVDNPFAWMARARVFVLSSAWEGFSNALLEALACGCPVVSTDCPSGSAEILADGAYGPLVGVGDDAALARAIESVLDHPSGPERLRARAAEFSVERAADGYLKVLLGLCRNRRAADAGRPLEVPEHEPLNRAHG